jgi:hypothetical protein
VIGRVLDTSALVDWATRRTRYVESIVWQRVNHTGYIAPLVIPAPALTAALAQIPADAVPVLDVLLTLEIHIVDPLTPGNAPAIAEILRAAGPYAPEALTAASVAYAAKSRGIPVTTGNAYPLQSLWTDIVIDPIP